jgi:hypothetical protein
MESLMNIFTLGLLCMSIGIMGSALGMVISDLRPAVCSQEEV